MCLARGCLRTLVLQWGVYLFVLPYIISTHLSSCSMSFEWTG